MGLETTVGNFFFRSKYANWLWERSTSSPFQVVRVIGAVLISVLLVARAANLFLYTKYAYSTSCQEAICACNAEYLTRITGLSLKGQSVQLSMSCVL